MTDKQLKKQVNKTTLIQAVKTAERLDCCISGKGNGHIKLNFEVKK